MTETMEEKCLTELRARGLDVHAVRDALGAAIETTGPTWLPTGPGPAREHESTTDGFLGRKLRLTSDTARNLSVVLMATADEADRAALTEDERSRRELVRLHETARETRRAFHAHTLAFADAIRGTPYEGTRAHQEALFIQAEFLHMLTETANLQERVLQGEKP